MATILSHGVAAAALTRVYVGDRKVSAAFWATAVVASMLPDLDVVGFRFGVRYDDLCGHRGLSHSLAAALVAGILLAWIWNGRVNLRRGFWDLALFFFLIVASHGILDAFTNGGLGVAFFSPFETHRYFFSVRPIQVSPIGLAQIFTARGWQVLRSEMLWIWLPSAVVFVFAAIF
jgi:inner membrane protein